jgi:hypothetical protein
LVVTNNIFLNQNWVGEDSTEVNSGSDPDKYFKSTILVDSISFAKHVIVQPKYWASADSSSYVSALDINKLKVFISNNINYWNPLLLEYFTNANNITGDGTTGYVNSWLDWGYGFQLPQRIKNMPCEWMNAHTQALFAAYAPPNGGFVADAPLSVSPGSPTIDNIDVATRDIMMAWNQNLWNDPNFPTAPNVKTSGMIFGDYDPKTIPGIDLEGNTCKENGIGITKFSDLAENWSSTVYSTIDDLPLGALSWNDAQIDAFNSNVDYELVSAAYGSKIGRTIAFQLPVGAIYKFELSQNCPNPFNPTTKIDFTLAKASDVKLTIYNVLGQKIATLVNSRMNAGPQSVVFNAGKFGSGVYFYRLDAGSFSSVKKMLLLK